MFSSGGGGGGPYLDRSVRANIALRCIKDPAGGRRRLMGADDNVGGQIAIIYCAYAEARLDGSNEAQRVRDSVSR